MNGAGQNRQSEGSEMDILYIAFGVLAAIAAILYFFHDQILSVILWLKYYELKLISFVMPNTHFQALENWVNMTSVQRISYQQLGFLSEQIGDVIRMPCAIISVILAAILYIFHPQRLYNEIESTESLADKVADIFPAIKVVEELDLVNTSIDSGPWSMALTPIEYAKKHRLIQRDPEDPTRFIANHLRAKMVFNAQLGARWRGIEALKPYQKAIFAILSAYVNFKRNDGDALLEGIAASVKKKNLATGQHDFSGVGTLLKKYAHSPAVTQITENHAYVMTVFTEMLVQARKSGIVANSLYLWLKPIDRCLWYTLNNVGRKAIYTEAAAIHAHWLTEKAVGYPISEPMIGRAITGLNLALSERVIDHHEDEQKPIESPKKTKKTKKTAAKKTTTTKKKTAAKPKSPKSTDKKA